MGAMLGGHRLWAMGFLLGLGLGLAACGEDPLAGRNCITNQDCEFGEACVGGACKGAEVGCTSDLECSVGESCNLASGECERTSAIACTIDTECPAGERCNPLTGVCIPGNRGCSADAECSAIGQVCEPTRSECVECYADSHCPEGTCTNNQCAGTNPNQCRSDLECAPPNTICEGGECVYGCTDPRSQLQCVDGFVCDNTTGRCASPPGCTTDTECGAPSSICEDGTCVAGCAAGGSCGTDEVCDPQSGRCVPVTGPCTSDAECGPPSSVCESGQCVGGCTQAGGIQCQGNETCNPGTGRCDPVMTPTCVMDSDCNPPSTVCESANGMCVPGCGTTGCATGQMCNATTGRCQAVQNPTGAALNESCSANADCESGLCFDFGGNVGSLCVSSCGTSLDCPTGFTCADYSGARTCLNARYFNGATFSAANGASCSSGGDCRSGYCRGGMSCVDSCAEDSDCSGTGCRWEEFATDRYITACAGNVGSGVNGATCSSDSDCRNGVCYGNGICGSMCGSTADCPNGTICGAVNYSRCLVPGGSSCLQWAVNLVKACVQVSAGNLGVGAMGTACTSAGDCRDGFCDENSNVCTGACSRNADCPATMKCGMASIGTLGGNPVYSNFCVVP